MFILMSFILIGKYVVLMKCVYWSTNIHLCEMLPLKAVSFSLSLHR